MDNSSPLQPTLIMIRGLPGSGKSFVANKLAETLGPEHVVILDPDALDNTSSEYLAFSKKLSAEGVDKVLHPFRWSRKRACDGIVDGKTVIWNQPFTDSGIFGRLVTFIEEYAKEQNVDMQTLLVEVDIDHDTAKQRIAERKADGGHGPSDATFDKRAVDYESLADEYRTVSIHGKNDVDQSVKMILEALTNATS